MPANPKFEVQLKMTGGPEITRDLKALGVDGERALKQLGQAATPANKGLQALDATSRGLQSQMGGLASRAGIAGEALSALGKGGLAAAAGLGAITVAMGLAIIKTREAIDHFSKLNDEAEQLGVDVELFQAWTYGFNQIGVSSEKATASLTKFNDNVGQIMLEGEDAPKGVIQAFDNLGISIETVQEMGGDLDAMLKLVADGMQNLGTTAEQTAAAKQLFGRAGAALVPILKEGSAGLREMTDSAREAGAVLESSLVKELDIAGDKLSGFAQVMDTQAARALRGFEDVLVKVASATASTMVAINDLLDAFRQSVPTTFADNIIAQFVPVLGTINNVIESVKLLNKVLGMAQDAVLGKKLGDLSGQADLTSETGAKALLRGPDPTTRLRSMGVQLLPEKQAPMATMPSLPSPTMRPSLGTVSQPRRSGGSSRKSGGAALPAAQEFPLWDMSEDFSQTFDQLEARAAEANANMAREAAQTMQRITQSHLQATGEVVKLIEMRRDEELAALEELGLSEEDYANAKIMINEDANRQIAEHEASMREQTSADRLDQIAFRKQEPLVESDWDKTRAFLLEFGEELTSVEGITQGVISSINSLGNTAIAAFADAVVAGEGFDEMLESLTTTIEKMIIQMTLQMALQAALGGGAIGIAGLMGPSGATGPAAGTAGGAPYAKGGIVQSGLPHGVYTNPTYFAMASPGITPMARGMGLMAESGPEAVVPLRRGPGGRLGIESSPTNVQVVVNNNAGADVQTSQQRGDDGSISIILDLVRKDIAGQMVRPGTMLNKSLSAAANPITKRA